MEGKEEFYTMKGYALHADGSVTSAMEDYLEMIARLQQKGQEIHVGDLSKMLHVKASSASKMVQQLAGAGLLQAERYGEIALTGRGRELGGYLLHRHEVLHRFLRILNHSENELEQVEKIEHFLDARTIGNLERLVARLSEPDVGAEKKSALDLRASLWYTEEK